MFLLWWKWLRLGDFYIDFRIARYAHPLISANCLTGTAGVIPLSDFVPSISSHPWHRRRSLRHPVAPQVLHSSIRSHTYPDNLLRRLRRNIHNNTNTTTTLLRRTLRPRNSLLHLHGKHSNILPEQHQHIRRNKRHRSVTMPGHSISTRPQRLTIPFHEIPTSSYRLTSVFAILPPPIHRCIPRTMVSQLVSSTRLRRRHILLFRGHGIRSRRHIGPFLENSAPALHTTNLQLHLFRTTTLPHNRLSTTSSPTLQRSNRSS